MYDIFNKALEVTAFIAGLCLCFLLCAGAMVLVFIVVRDIWQFLALGQTIFGI